MKFFIPWLVLAAIIVAGGAISGSFEVVAQFLSKAGNLHSYFDTSWLDKKTELAKVISADLRVKGAPDKFAENMGMCQATKLVSIAEAGKCPLKAGEPVMKLLEACVASKPELFLDLSAVLECLNEVKLEGENK